MKDLELQQTLEETKLPHLRRQSVRQPLSREDWRKALKLMQGVEPPELRAVLQIIAARGIRCGDVLRLRKREILEALRTGALAYEAKGEKRIEYSALLIKKPLAILAKMDGAGDRQVYEVVSTSMASAGRRVRNAIKRIEKACGFGKGELFAHRFRHTFVNAFLEELEGDPRAAFILQDEMGWTSPNTARNYVRHAERSELEKIERRIAFGGRKKKK